MSWIDGNWAPLSRMPSGSVPSRKRCRSAGPQRKPPASKRRTPQRQIASLPRIPSWSGAYSRPTPLALSSGSVTKAKSYGLNAHE